MTQGEFAELDKEKLEMEGIEISSSSWSTSSESVSDTDDDGTVKFRRSSYVCKKTERFAKPVKIDKSLFKNFPEKVKMEPVWIK